MNKKLTALWMPALIIVIIDQFTKHLVRTTPGLQDWNIIPGWLAFHYTQNPGMALGMDWVSTPLISSIAILATIGIIIYILKTLDNANIGYLTCMGLVLGGAFGNIIDRLVMGYIGSYGGLLEGHVIDFVHFTLQIDGYPVFPYIFNVADISISLAIITLLVFHNRILPATSNEEEIGETAHEAPGLSDRNREMTESDAGFEGDTDSTVQVSGSSAPDGSETGESRQEGEQAEKTGSPEYQEKKEDRDGG